jgi:hypothetical protein
VKKSSPTERELKEVTDELVQSALQWLGRAIDSFTSRDQEFELTLLYSAISFEGFAKALVIHLQWEQVFSVVKKADFVKLKSGEAHTVAIPEARLRLREVIKIDCTKELARFERLIGHRNKIVHFYHPDLDSVANRRRIATEMLQGWSGLLELKKKSPFVSLFEAFEEDFRGIEREFLKLDSYLAAQEIRIHEESGCSSHFDECSFCRKHTFDYTSSTCRLCGIRESTHADWMDGDYGVQNAECPKCGGYETVMPLEDGGGRCKGCKQFFEVFDVCDYCSASYVLDKAESGDIPPEDQHSTAFLGCGQNDCRGSLGRLMEKD